MLAKAVANNTTATFIRVVGSEFVQKYLGEGPRMVRDVFRLVCVSEGHLISLLFVSPTLFFSLSVSTLEGTDESDSFLSHWCLSC